jgi:hypothetical protein
MGIMNETYYIVGMMLGFLALFPIAGLIYFNALVSYMESEDE